MGITLTQLTNTVEKLKQYTDNNIPEISPETNNAIQSKDDGLFVDDKQPQIDFIRVKLDPIVRYQRYVNTELDYIYCQINENQTIKQLKTFFINYNSYTHVLLHLYYNSIIMFFKDIITNKKSIITKLYFFYTLLHFFKFTIKQDIIIFM